MKPADVKLQRWIDLLAALLDAHYGLTFEELRSAVPSYGRGEKSPTLLRMFERDKDELRAHGIPIRVRADDEEDGASQRYYVHAKEMYLPFLALAAAKGSPPRSRPLPPRGYRDIPTLAFEPDEISALLTAARRAEAVGDRVLARDAQSSIRKLTYDLGVGIGTAVDPSTETTLRPEPKSAPTVTLLGDALLRCKKVDFKYHSINRDTTTTRTVEPYGLFFLGSHWYLAARDLSADEIRSFRVSRISGAKVNAKKAQSADYEIPSDFSLAAYARAKEPWEIGDDMPQEMIVEFRGDSGVTLAARTLGKPVLNKPNQRKFSVRRVESFVRWLMSFAGEVVPVSPAELTGEYARMIAETAAVYSRAAK